MQPLEGIKVLELGQWVAAPAACGVLAEWGAEVIKVESLDGDGMRNAKSTGNAIIGDFNFLWELDNHNKKSITLDLKLDEGLDIFRKLIKEVDVLVTNFRLDSLKKLGLDYENLCKINPRLIYANITGFGQKGPDKNKRGFDAAAFWARSGVMASLGEPGTPLCNSRQAFGDHITAMNLVAGIAMALVALERTGVGQEVTVSLMASGIWAMSVDIQTNLSLGKNIPRLSRKEAGNPLYNCYETKDGLWLQFNMLQTDPYWSPFCQAAERPDLEHNPNFDSHAKRCEHNKELIAIIDTIMSGKNMEDWANTLNKYDIIWGRVHTIAEVTADPQVIANEYFGDLNHPNQGKIRLVTSPIKLSKTPARVLEAAPELSQHTEEMLLQVGYTWDDIARLKEKRVIL